jgi:hypothetical protein
MIIYVVRAFSVNKDQHQAASNAGEPAAEIAAF